MEMTIIPKAILFGLGPATWADSALFLLALDL
jgi:hypothetical protein